MALPDVIAAVTARLAAVPSARNVYSYAREAKEASAFLKLFSVAGANPAVKTIHAWMVTRAATAVKDEEVQTYRRTHEIVMMGYFAVDDAANSEGIFQQIVEDICQAFDPLSLRQYDGLVDWSEPVQVDGPTVLMYGAYLCHAVKLVHRVQEVIYP
jgi:hypothetical protein